MKRSVLRLYASVAVFTLMFASANAYSATTTTFQANGTSAMTLACTNNCSSQLYLRLYSSQGGGTTSWMILFGVFGSDTSGNRIAITVLRLWNRSTTDPAAFRRGNWRDEACARNLGSTPRDVHQFSTGVN